MKGTTATSITQSWIKDIVIGQNFCPFAAQPFLDGSIRYVETDGSDFFLVLQRLVEELKYLDQHPEIETTFIIFHKGLERFQQYLDLLSIAEQLLEKESYSGVYQMASFHPQYIFRGSKDDDASNYTNRSPYPMIHLIREASMDIVVSKHKDVRSIPVNNILKANELGLTFFVNWQFRHLNENK